MPIFANGNSLRKISTKLYSDIGYAQRFIFAKNTLKFMFFLSAGLGLYSENTHL